MSAEDNLLFGLLALHNGFVSREQLLEGMNAWLVRQETPLSIHLCQLGHLPESDRRLLDDLVERQIQRQGSVPRSLAALSLDPRMCQDVQACLASVSVWPDTISPSTGPETARAALGFTPPSPTGAWKRYAKLRPHAKGGLGEVSVARDEELRREVALKEIQEPFADDYESRRRFLREAEITGNLEHPGIVPVYGLCEYPDGRPLYAMRFVHGESLHEAIRNFHAADKQARDPGERSLALRGLLTRFVTVCNAVAYAHSQGVLHRDLKPGNVMLGRYGETLVVDWGLACVMRPKDSRETTPIALQRLTAHELWTLPGQVMGTPAFMSPEQARGEKLGVPSDVFALGATLYALLTGEAPYRGENVLEQVQHGEFVSPRNTNLRTPRPLEAVCLKAMARQPEDRYGSASELAEEVEHWLADEPVKAYPEPVRERVRRWTRRHRTLVTSTVVLLAVSVVALGLGLAAVALERAETVKQRDRALLAEAKANDNFARARQAVDQCFGVAKEDPLFQADNMEEARKRLLEKTLPFYEWFTRERAEDETLAAERADYLYHVGEITALIGRKAEAIKSYEQSREICLRLNQESPETRAHLEMVALTSNNLGNLYEDVGRPTEAMECYVQARAAFVRLGEAYPDWVPYQSTLAKCWNNLGWQQRQMGKLQDAEASYQQAKVLRQKLVKDNPSVAKFQSELAQTWNHLGILQCDTGKYPEALKSYQQAKALQQKVSEEWPEMTKYQEDLARILHNLAHLQSEIGQLAEARQHYLQAKAIRQRLSQQHPKVTRYQADLAITCNHFGLLCSQTSNPREALANYEQARSLRQKLKQTHPEVSEYARDLAETLNNLASLQYHSGELEEALQAWTAARDALEPLTRTLPDVPRIRADLAKIRSNLGALYHEKNDVQKALASYHQARDDCRQLVATHPGVPEYQVTLGSAYNNLGNLHRDTGNLEQALINHTLARDVRITLCKVSPQVIQYQTDLAWSWTNLGIVYADTDKRQEALTSYQHARDIHLQVLQAHPNSTTVQAALAGTYFNLSTLQSKRNKPNDALDNLSRAISLLDQVTRRDSGRVVYVQWLAKAYASRAKVLSQLARPRDARADWDALLRLNLSPADRAEYRLKYAETRLDLGDYRQAMVEVAELSRDQAMTAALHYDLACLAARSAAAVAGDRGRPLAERGKLADAWARHAVALLNHIARAGFFRNPAIRAHLHKDTDLDFLRTRPDYADFVHTLPAAVKP